MNDPLTAIVCLLILILVSLWRFEAKLDREERREARRAKMNPVDREMDELNPDGFSS